MPGHILVVSREGERRRDWSRELAREGEQVSRCAARDCPLLWGAPCDLLGTASAAVYDEDALSPALFLSLVREPSRPTVLFARDDAANGRHHPRFTRKLDASTARGAPHPK